MSTNDVTYNLCTYYYESDARLLIVIGKEKKQIVNALFITIQIVVIDYVFL